ncbi:MAG: HPr kinase/phosphorylase [Halothiobacillaceae bacterium]|nr:MAG: HPr kinase/phosphorylase [Halothiobacillaceae bacterium]
MKTLTTQGIFEPILDKLQLSRRVTGEERLLYFTEANHQDTVVDNIPSEVGYLNFIRPNQIQVLGQQELSFLNGLGKNSLHDALAQLFSHKPVAIVVGDNAPPPPLLLSEAERRLTPLYLSALATSTLVEHLRHHLSRRSAKRTTRHGVFMEVMGIGVLLAGPSGVGKSELALELISRGHRLIADDAPFFTRLAPDAIMGKCPKALQDFLEVRGLGILDIRSMFGDNSLKHQETLHLIVQLKRMSDSEVGQLDRLQGNMVYRTVLDVEIPELTLPVIMGSNLAVLVEGAVRNHLLLMKGYNATETFIERQRRFISQGDV